MVRAIITALWSAYPGEKIEMAAVFGFEEKVKGWFLFGDEATERRVSMTEQHQRHFFVYIIMAMFVAVGEIGKNFQHQLER